MSLYIIVQCVIQVKDPLDSDARPIVDRDNTVFGALGGRPLDKDPGSGEVPWSEVQRRMCIIFEYLRNSLHVNKSQVEHRRGNFPAVAVGISFGGGQKVCEAIPNPLVTLY